MSACDHATCPEARCRYTLPASIDDRFYWPALYKIEDSNVRVGQRYRSWQHGDVAVVTAIGVSPESDDPLEPWIAFEIIGRCVTRTDRDRQIGMTYFKELRYFTDSIGDHKRWELLP